MSKKIDPKITCESKEYDRTAKEVEMVVKGEPEAVLKAAVNWWHNGLVRVYSQTSDRTCLRIIFCNVRSPLAAGRLFEEFRQEVAAVLAA